MSNFRERGALPLVCALSIALSSLVVPSTTSAQAPDDLGGHAAILKRDHPGLYDLMLRIERAHGLMFGGLAAEGDAMRERKDSIATYGFELDMVERLTALVGGEGTVDDVEEEAAAGYAVLGPRAAQIIARGNAFWRETLGILAGEQNFQARRAALAAAVERYQSHEDVALPVIAKNMDILYQHPYTEDFRRGYADLDGFVWAGLWLNLAASEPITDFTGEARRSGIDTVTTRYQAKLSYGEPPEFFPSELPLAPTIAPGLIFISPETAMIWDNLSMLQEVLADILAAPDVPDVQEAVDEAVAFFMDPVSGITDQGQWEIMALRHGIFFQGGYPLAFMKESELNVGGHAAHLQAGGAIIIPGMPG